jgi:cobalamin biosynthetic protein CobC
VSLAEEIPGNVVVLKSFGKFYGLAGLRLGFVLAGDGPRAAQRDLAWPWAVSGAAIAVGRAALPDAVWRQRTLARLGRDAGRLDTLALEAGWTLTGGTCLYRLYDVGDAAAVQERLAAVRIWSRHFPSEASLLRLGLPDRVKGWEQVEDAFFSCF